MHYSSLPTPNITGNYSFRLNFTMEAGIIRISVNDSNRYVQMYECWNSRHEMIVCSSKRTGTQSRYLHYCASGVSGIDFVRYAQSKDWKA